MKAQGPKQSGARGQGKMWSAMRNESEAYDEASTTQAYRKPVETIGEGSGRLKSIRQRELSQRTHGVK